MLTKKDKERQQLKRQLLSGRITGDIFVKAVTALDQSTKYRVDASANLKLLTTPTIVAYFDTHIDDSQAYQDLLSLTYWHVGQKFAIMKNNRVKAIENFTLAYESSLKAGSRRHRAWRAYIQASIAYLKSDLKQVKINYAKMPLGDGNRQIIKNFIDRLERNEDPDYLIDYGLNR